MFLVYWQYHGDLFAIYRQLSGPRLQALAEPNHLKRIDKCVGLYLVIFAAALLTFDTVILCSVISGSVPQRVAYEDVRETCQFWQNS